MSKLQLSLVALVVGGVALLLFSKPPKDDATVRGWDSAITLKDVRAGKPFSGTVLEIRYGDKGPEFAGNFAYVLVLVKTTDGKRLALFEREPGTNARIFAASLIVGRSYEFSSAMLDAIARHGTKKR